MHVAATVVLAGFPLLVEQLLARVLADELRLAVRRMPSWGRAAPDDDPEPPAGLGIVDVGTPAGQGVKWIEKLVDSDPRRPVVAVGCLADDSCEQAAALAAGAREFVVTCDGCDALLAVVRRLVGGAGASGGDPDQQAKRADDRQVQGLTRCEKQVVRLFADGEDRNHVAAALHRSPHTVDNHLRNAMRKLGLHNRAQLTRYAIRQGLIEP